MCTLGPLSPGVPAKVLVRRVGADEGGGDPVTSGSPLVLTSRVGETNGENRGAKGRPAFMSASG